MKMLMKITIVVIVVVPAIATNSPIDEITFKTLINIQFKTKIYEIRRNKITRNCS